MSSLRFLSLQFVFCCFAVVFQEAPVGGQITEPVSFLLGVKADSAAAAPTDPLLTAASEVNPVELSGNCRDEVADSCLVRSLFFGNHDLQWPHTRRDMMSFCDERVHGIECFRSYGFECLPGFNDSLTLNQLDSSTQEWINLCNNAQHVDDFVLFTKCFEAKQTTRLHNCMTTFTDKLDWILEYNSNNQSGFIETGSESSESKQYKSMCCSVSQLYTCLEVELHELCAPLLGSGPLSSETGQVSRETVYLRDYFLNMVYRMYFRTLDCPGPEQRVRFQTECWTRHPLVMTHFHEIDRQAVQDSTRNAAISLFRKLASLFY